MRSAPTITESLQEYGRGIGGGLLFSLPLLYTMEVWWTGFIAHPTRLLVMLGFTFVLLLGYNRFAGIRYDASWAEVAIDSVEELGLGVVTAAAVLYLLGQIGPGLSLDEIIGKTVVEAAVVAIGVSVGTAQLGSKGGPDTGAPHTKSRSHLFLNQVVIAFCGAIVFAANIAPTEEVLVIAVESSAGRLIALALLSILLGAMILYYVDFARTDTIIAKHGNLDIVIGSATSYAVALVASSMVLWFFGHFDDLAVEECISKIVVLGFPAALGASAGRVILQPQ